MNDPGYKILLENPKKKLSDFDRTKLTLIRIKAAIKWSTCKKNNVFLALMSYDMGDNRVLSCTDTYTVP